MSKTDEELMLEYRDGNDAAFVSLYERYKQPIYRFVFHKVWDQGRAEEITHEVFMAIVKYHTSWRPEALFKTYLYSIARKRCISELTRKERKVIVRPRERDEEDGPPLPEPAVPSSQYEELERSEMNLYLGQALEKLDDLFREPIILEMNGLSREEIAEQLSIPVETVKTRIFRAKTKLKTILGRILAQRVGPHED